MSAFSSSRSGLAVSLVAVAVRQKARLLVDLSKPSKIRDSVQLESTRNGVSAACGTLTADG